MSEDLNLDTLDEMGPVDYVVIEFPDTSKLTGEGFAKLLDLVDRGIVRIIDLMFVKKETDGSLTGVAITDIDGDGTLDLAVFEGASSGLLGQDDVDEAGSALEPGSLAALIVWENLWAAPLAVTLRKSGAQMVASGRIPVQAILAALEAENA